jgi:hypothetical protein
MFRPRLASPQCSALLALVALTVLAWPARAQLWMPVPTFNCGNWSSCVAGPSATFALYQGNLYRSNDAGSTWSPEVISGVRAFTAVDALGGGMVLGAVTLIGPDGDPPALYESFDDGLTWGFVGPISSIPEPVVALLGTTGSNVQFAITQHGNVYKNPGFGWESATSVPGGTNPYPVVHDALIDGTSLYVANDNGVYLSTDDASSWNHPYALQPALHLALDPSAVGDYFSTASATYQFIDGPVQIASQSGSLCTLSDGSLLIDGRHRYSGGTINSYPGPLGTVNQVAVVSRTTLMAATSQGVLRSMDDGVSWSDVTAPTRLPLTLLGAVGTSGVVVNVDGATFVSPTSGAPMLHTVLDGATQPIAVVPIPGGGIAVSATGRVFRSSDDGATWVELAFDPSVHVSALTRTASGLLVLGTNYGASPLYVSSDKGDTWSPAGSYFGGQHVTALASAGGTIFAASTPDLVTANVFASTDGGANWTLQSSGGMPSPPTQIAAASAQQVYALSGGALYGSASGGASWGGLLASGVQSVVVDGSGRVWVAMQLAPTVRMSSDQGGTWIPEAGGTSGAISSLVLTSSQTMYASGSAGGFRSVGAVSLLGAPEPGPSASHFGIALAGANPVRGELRLACSVEHAGPLLLAVLDVTGRCVARNELAAPAAGTWSVTLARPPHPGMYFIRAKQDGHTSTTRAAIVR